MKSKFWIVLLAVLIVTAFVVQPLAAQECAGCTGCQEMGEEASCGMEGNGEVSEDNGPNQEKCPVMGSAINKDVYADYNGKRVYFCCPGCDKKFMNDPEKYLGEMKKQDVVLAATPCPVSGKPSNAEIFAEYDGNKVYFCCEGCKTTYSESPEKYMKKS